MHHTTARIAGYAGAGIAGLATSCILAAPALALENPEPFPGSQNPTNSTSPVGSGGSSTTQSSLQSASDGIDWTALAAGLGAGALLTGVFVVGATQLRHHPAHPA